MSETGVGLNSRFAAGFTALRSAIAGKAASPRANAAPTTAGADDAPRYYGKVNIPHGDFDPKAPRGTYLDIKA